MLTPPSAATNNAERREGHAGHLAKTDRASWQQNERVGHAISQTSSKTCPSCFVQRLAIALGLFQPLHDHVGVALVR